MTRPAAGAARRRRILGENILAYAFVLPAILVILIFQFLPGFAAVYMSLFRWDIVQGAFRGLDNSLRLPVQITQHSTKAVWLLDEARDERQWSGLRSSVLSPCSRTCSPEDARSGDLLTLYYLPYITSVIVAVIFNWLMNPSYGLFNTPGFVGIGPRNGSMSRRDHRFARFSFVDRPIGPVRGEQPVPSIDPAGPSLAPQLRFHLHDLALHRLPGRDFLAGPGNISNEYYEAARLDGERGQIFTKITPPPSARRRSSSRRSRPSGR
jgi:hypothetical protein